MPFDDQKLAKTVTRQDIAPFMLAVTHSLFQARWIFEKMERGIDVAKDIEDFKKSTEGLNERFDAFTGYKPES